MYGKIVNTEAILCFGMVAPSHQRQGIGTAQLLVRLALLEPVDGVADVAMMAVPGSVSFYRRFGVIFMKTLPGNDGSFYAFGQLRVTASEIEDCRALLAERRIVYPDVRDQIPRP